MQDTGKEWSEGSVEEFEIKFYEKILEQQPNFIECAQVLAALYTKNGMYKNGLELDRRLSQLLPNDPIVFYNLACSYSLTGDMDSSLDVIKKAIELGFDDFDHIYNDPDLINLRKDRRFQDILSRNIKSKNIDR